jgi:hypothetical protein
VRFSAKAPVAAKERARAVNAASFFIWRILGVRIVVPRV